MFNRLVTLIDMDCFYCQVEARLNPSLQGKPIAVVQYNTWKGGGIIAVNYEARNLGVTRRMRGVDAKKHCPEIELVAVPDIRGKADLTKYRDASREVIAVLNEFSPCVEKASIDEAYLDLTEVIEKRSQRVRPNDLQNTFVVGYPDEEGAKQWLNDLYNGGINDDNLLKLAQAAALVEEIRATVYEKTGFRCSAGISHNKILAKLSCGLHKPNKQTVLPHSSIQILYETLPVEKIRNLGGKFGDSVKEQLNCTTMSEVSKFSLKELQQKFGDKSGTWLYNIARGIDTEPVKSRIVSKSLGCCKNFPAHTALTTKKDVRHWVEELAEEVYDRIQNDLITNKRRATLLTASTNYEENGKVVVFSRSAALNNYTMEEIINSSMILLSKSNTAPPKSEAWIPPLNFLGMSVSKFIDTKNGGSSLLNFFKPLKSKSNENESVKNEDSSINIQSPVLFPETEFEKENNTDIEMKCPSIEMKSELSKNNVQTSSEKILEQTLNAEVTPSSCEKELKQISKPEPQSSVGEKIPEAVSKSEPEPSSCKTNETTSKVDSPHPTRPLNQFTKKPRAWSPIPFSSGDPEFDEGIAKILDKYCSSPPRPNVYDDPMPSTSKACHDPPPGNIDDIKLGFDYSKSFFVRELKDEQIYVPISYEEPFKRNKPGDKNKAGDTVDESIPMEIDEPSTSTNTVVERCAECHKLIPLVDFLEHLDHHAALKLQRELNREEMAANRAEMANSNTSNSANTSTSRAPEKRKSKKLRVQSPDKKNQPITAYFSVKPPS